ncbi:glycoside hydrolase family 30 beta sandwich domain-containing protein [Reichenbachiella sp. MSK19-1]|uniref:glycoside hydrolase family 30 protein n=1 Tax=Reichenbachiella sp. MSK19-1 TaxID=1897631 RepID=UPI0021013820|nr:glycoside hydrolase family 30 beta sandwich domain-containing protein [Reichenbachiella sp. MSK19-1]
MMNRKVWIAVLWGMCLCLLNCAESDETVAPPPPVVEPPETNLPEVMVYLTKANESVKFAQQEGLVGAAVANASINLTINPEIGYQDIDGFGFALTGGSAQHISQMSDAAQDDLLQELFGTEGDGIGISYLRISIGASDLDASVFSYNDLPQGETDMDQLQFSIEPDRAVLIPLLKKILEIKPDLKLMATPWSPPVWMKTNGASKGGRLLTEYYDSYALYLVKYLQAMEAEGITIETISIQNEPLHGGNNPSMEMSAEEQNEFIKSSLGPLFAAHDISTKVVLYDHNADMTSYPISILDDEETRQYVDGSGFHLYAGDISALSSVHNSHPDKNIYFTEQWFGAPGNFSGDLQWHIREIIIGATRNWSRNVIEWNLSSAPNLQPHTDGGCTACLGGIEISGNTVSRKAGYYVIAHASKFVVPGSTRISSNYTGEIPNVSFLTPEGQIVLLALNNTDAYKTFNMTQGELSFSASLDAGAVATFVWDPNQTIE